LKWHLGGKDFFFFWGDGGFGKDMSKVVTMFKHLLGCNTIVWVLTLPNVMWKYNQPKSKWGWVVLGKMKSDRKSCYSVMLNLMMIKTTFNCYKTVATKNCFLLSQSCDDWKFCGWWSKKHFKWWLKKFQTTINFFGQQLIS
jgi:hypothetical protein